MDRGKVTKDIKQSFPVFRTKQEKRFESTCQTKKLKQREKRSGLYCFPVLPGDLVEKKFKKQPFALPKTEVCSYFTYIEKEEK